MIDFQSTLFRQNVLNTLVELEDTNRVAFAFNEYVTQAVDRVCIISKPTGRVKDKGAPWFNKECRQKRTVAIQAGHRVESTEDRQTQIEACRQYRAHKQRKRREYLSNCVRSIVDIYQSDRSKVWQIIQKLSGPNCDYIGPSDNEFFYHFKNKSGFQTEDSFNPDNGATALKFLHQYDIGGYVHNSSLEYNIINDSITNEETCMAIDCLKNGKSRGTDVIRAEFVKSCKSMMHRLDAGNYRGITVLPVMEKIFETIVYRRLSFAKEAFDKSDTFNGGFLPGCRTADNIFILQGLVQHQLCIGSSLVVCFVDFFQSFWFY